MLRKLSLTTALLAAIVTLPSVASAYDQGGYRTRDYGMRDRDRDRDRDDFYGSSRMQGHHYGWERGHHYGRDYDRDRDRDDYRMKKGDHY